MRDSLSIINEVLTKDDNTKYRVKDFSVTYLNHTYITVECCTTKCRVNYRFTDFRSFLTDNGFSLAKSTAKSYQFKN